jgi:plastocyanin
MTRMNSRTKILNPRSVGASTRAVASVVLVVVLIAALGTLIYLNPPSASSQNGNQLQYTNYGQTSSVSTTSTSTGVPSNAVMVNIPDDGGYPYAQYTPQVITVIIGVNNTVLWTNADRIVHNVLSTTGAFGSGDIGPGAQYWFTFTQTGSYAYYCSYHPSMAGVIIVRSQ